MPVVSLSKVIHPLSLAMTLLPAIITPSLLSSIRKHPSPASAHVVFNRINHTLSHSNRPDEVSKVY
ncbi:hypothetical protein N657DRAFT_641452 [Parathielavia appendiculata]|uniref:Uncharacterized protein n=1 Tax=Parathielavia appendiculata TaxID=2587402 RepID=A0AAN6U6Q9_9PEZI|nr:hypothetical protein N657DRAFT_641452 [Parathielavia appendiculata]